MLVAMTPERKDEKIGERIQKWYLRGKKIRTLTSDGKEDQMWHYMGRKIKRVTSKGKNFAKLSFPSPVRASLHTLLVIFNLSLILYLGYLYLSCIGICICNYIAMYLYLHHHIPVSASLHTLLVIFNLLLSSTETDARSQHHDLAKNHLKGYTRGKVVKEIKVVVGYRRGKAVVVAVGYRAFLLGIAPFLIHFPFLP